MGGEKDLTAGAYGDIMKMECRPKSAAFAARQEGVGSLTDMVAARALVI